MPKPTKSDAVEKEVVRLLAECREQTGISKNELSQRTGLSRAAIRLIEEMKRKPTLYTLLRISEGLGVELWELLKEAGAVWTEPKDRRSK